RPLDPRDPPLGAVGMAVPLLRPRARWTLGVRRARLGRLLGLGSGGDRGLHALVDGHRVLAFRYDPGKARHAKTLEYAVDHRDLRPGDLRYLPDSFRCAFLCALLRPECNRTPVLHLHWINADRFGGTAHPPLEQSEIRDRDDLSA